MVSKDGTACAGQHAQKQHDGSFVASKADGLRPLGLRILQPLRLCMARESFGIQPCSPNPTASCIGTPSLCRVSHREHTPAGAVARPLSTRGYYSCCCCVSGTKQHLCFRLQHTRDREHAAGLRFTRQPAVPRLCSAASCSPAPAGEPAACAAGSYPCSVPEEAGRPGRTPY